MLNTIYRLCATMLPIALEGLPVSSSGHVLLAAGLLSRVWGVDVAGLVPESLDHLVHLPIAIVVALFFLPRWFYLLTHLTHVWQQFLKVFFLGFITVAATGCIYFLVQHFGTSWFPLWIGYACTAVLLFSLRLCDEKNNTGLWTVVTALVLGTAQGLALLPGISRLGITYVTARWLGMRSQKAFELSFLIEWPISVAGFAKGVFDMHKAADAFRLTSFDMLAMSVASVLAFAGLWVMRYLVRTERVWLVGYYVAVLAVISFVLCV